MPAFARIPLTRTFVEIARNMRWGRYADKPAVKPVSPIELCVDDVDYFSENPRLRGNSQTATIRLSMQSRAAQGLPPMMSPPLVAINPKTGRYTLIAGGNTRLAVQQELWRASGNPIYRHATFLVSEWQGETQVLLDHLVENSAREDLSYFEEALAIDKARRQIQRQLDLQEISLRRLEDELSARGVQRSRTTLGRDLFAVKVLGQLGDVAYAIPQCVVRDIQPMYGMLERLCEKSASRAMALLQQAMVALESDYAQRLTVDFATFESAFAEVVQSEFGLSLSQMRRVVDLMQCGYAQPQAIATAQAESASLVAGEAEIVSAVTPMLSELDMTAVAEGLSSQPEAEVTTLDDSSNGRPGLIDDCRKLAEQANLQGCVLAHDASPLGYFMEPAEGEGAPRPEWLLLAYACGQLSDEKIIEAPPTSRWSGIQRSGGRMHQMRQAFADSYSDIFARILNPRDRTGEMMLKIVRKLRSSSA